MRLTSNLRYYFDRNGAARTTAVRDWQHLSDPLRTFPFAPRQWNIPEDYVIITRMLDAAMERTVVLREAFPETPQVLATHFW